MKRILQVIFFILAIYLGFDLTCQLIVNILWFQELGYLSAFLLKLKTQLLLIAIAIIIFILLFYHIIITEKWQHFPRSNQEYLPILPNYKPPQLTPAKPHPILGKFPIFLTLVVLISFLLTLMIIYYAQITISSIINPEQNSIILPFKRAAFTFILKQILSKKWLIIVITAITSLLLIYPKKVLKIFTLILPICLGITLTQHWTDLLFFIHPEKFNLTEPVFDQDIGFYIFQQPFLQQINLILYSLSLFLLLSTTLIYLLSGNSLSNGNFIEFTPIQIRHLQILSSVFVLSITFNYWLKRYDLLYSHRGVTYGASYTDINIQLPIYNLLIILGIIITIILLLRTIIIVRSWKSLITKLASFLILSIIITWFLPDTVQKLVVRPNELELEKPYIERSINFTKKAFDLNKIETKLFNPQGKLTKKDLVKNAQTISNIRLWDDRPLLATNRQLQQIRSYYKFANADIDRYTLTDKNNQQNKQQIIISARELDYKSVPEKAQTWVNEHLVYTHGYGFTVSPVNTVVEGGLPDYFVKDIGMSDNGQGKLWTKNELIADTIPIANPRIYYGEMSDTYIMTGTKVPELDYPSGQENVFNIYDGSGGIKLNNFWLKLVFAKYLNDKQILLTDNFTAQTKILNRRNIIKRVQAIAPFLHYDNDPYLVVVNSENNSHLYWIIDSYTTSDRYPYSDRGKLKFNYIRNSVKVIIDAYNGTVKFYTAEPAEPIIKTWKKMLPDLFQPLEKMPKELQKHLRYPGDLFYIQAETLLNYHMSDAQVFYNKEDQWQIPQEIYGNKPQPVAPYYLITKLPTATTEEFILLLPFTPIQRTNLIAWLAGRSDSEEYGKLLLYEFPKQKLIYGTEQIEALINQDPQISQQISLWNRAGSRVIQGNLLVIPIENSLLYVEPLYLEAEQNSLPTLARVVVAYQNRIIMAENLEKALAVVFKEQN
jgi:uncharacterized protein